MTNVTEFRTPQRDSVDEQIAALVKPKNFAAPIPEEFVRRARRVITEYRKGPRWRVRWQEWPEVQALAPELLEAVRPLLERLELVAHDVGASRAMMRAALPEVLSHICTLHGAPPPDSSPDDKSGGTAA